MLVGRGYRVSAQIESKMKLNINSGTGSNSGVYRIKYNDGEEICYICPSGEVSGLAYGDRKFNMIGKGTRLSLSFSLWLVVEKRIVPVNRFQSQKRRLFRQAIDTYRLHLRASLSGQGDILQVVHQEWLLDDAQENWCYQVTWQVSWKME